MRNYLIFTYCMVKMIWKKSNYVRIFFCSIGIILHMPRFYHSTLTNIFPILWPWHLKRLTYSPLAKTRNPLFLMFNYGNFSPFLELANVIPVFKKDCKNSTNNYRPTSILKIISKVYERIFFKQIGTFMEKFLFKISMRFQKRL